MKYSLQNIRGVDKNIPPGEAPSLICAADTGSIGLTVFSARKILVSYRFKGIEVPPVLEASHLYLRGRPPVEDGRIEVSENPRQYIAEIHGPGERTDILIEKQTGNLAFVYNGTVVHGGALGSEDTVIPGNQLRCIRENENPLPLYRFNFPLKKRDAFYGLGDKTGRPNRRGRRFRMFNRDALGYDAELSDPLYKSIPFFIKHNRDEKILAGLYFPESCLESFDFGRESPFYYSAEISGGPASYYIFLGKDYGQLLHEYCTVTGFPALPPLFSFGFFGSSMNYTEPGDAADRILMFFAEVEKKEIPCEGMYVSSGYLKADNGSRYAFFWNKRKFPNPKEFLSSLTERGYNLCMNIKPGILKTHPWYGELLEKGYFVSDEHGEPCVEYYWGGEASFLDFSNSGAREWWKGKLKEHYIENGCTGIWNDNNELELEDSGLHAFLDRTLYPNKMAEAAYEAFQECLPDIRPWIYSRAGYAGIQKYARTWSGDNVSDWKTLEYNQFQSIGLGLSGIPFYGHDLGGFFGAVPEEELLLRSCQSGVFQPRFVIHSWRENGEPTEPWTYPGIFPQIRNCILEHYRFVPYIYDCAFEASRTGLPLDRPLFLEFPEDPECLNSQSMFGPWVLKIPALEKGTEEIPVHLPAGEDWYDPEEGILFPGGTNQRAAAALNGCRWFAKAGSVIPTAPELHSLVSGCYPQVSFLVFPPAAERTVLYRHFEDQGRYKLSRGLFSLWEFRILPQKEGGLISFEKTASGLPEPQGGRLFTLKLPAGFSFCDSSGSPDSVTVNSLEKSFSVSYRGAYIHD
jgi:alpha-glucosidase